MIMFMDAYDRNLYDSGYDSGYDDGAEKQKLKMVRNLLSQGVSDHAFIAKVADMTVQEVAEAAHGM